MRRGRDRHLHGQVFLPLEYADIIHSDVLLNHCSLTKRKAQIHGACYGMQVLARLCTMIHWAPLSIEFLIWCGTIATLVTSTCCRTKQVFVSDCMQKRSLYAAGKWFPKLTDFRKLVLPSRTLFTAIEVAGLIEATLDGFIEVTFHAQAIVEFPVPGISLPPWARGYQLVHRPDLLSHSVKRLRFALARTPKCKQALSLTNSRRQVTLDFNNHCHARTVPWMSNDHSVFFRPGRDL